MYVTTERGRRLMNILILTNKVPYPPKDGGAIASYGLISSFAESGNKVTVLAMHTLKHPVSEKDIPSKENIEWHLVDVPARATFFGALSNLLFSRKPYNAIRFINRGFRKRLVALLNQQPFDVVQLEGLYVCPYIDMVRAHSSATIVYRSHNIESEIWQRTMMNVQGLKKFYLKILASRITTFEQYFANKWDLLLPITARDGTIWNNQLGNQKPVWVCPAGVDIDKKKSDGGHLPGIFHIGALDWMPNQEGVQWFLNHCWPAIRKEYPQVCFTIAGRNAPAWFEKQLKKTEGVNYIGEVESAREFIRDNGIMIVPLLSGSGMRIKIVEGLAMSKAIVSTSIGVEGIDAENGKHLIVADGAAAFTQSVTELLENKQKAIRMGEAGYKLIAEKFDTKKIAEGVIGFYQKHLNFE